MLFNWELRRGRGDQGLYLYKGTACLLHAAHYRELGQYHDRVYHRGPNRGPGLRRRTMTISTTRFHIRLRRPPWQVALACGLGRAVAPSSHHACRVACRLISTRSLTMASADHIHLEKKKPMLSRRPQPRSSSVVHNRQGLLRCHPRNVNLYPHSKASLTLAGCHSRRKKKKKTLHLFSHESRMQFFLPPVGSG